MKDPDRGVIVVTSCTARKHTIPANGHGPIDLTAESLYRGQQHVRLMQGVASYRDAGRPAGPLRLQILSACYGLIPAGKRVVTYNHTFAGLPRDVIREKAAGLDVPRRIRRLLRRPSALALLLLGDDYLAACDLDADVRLGGPAIAFCAPKVARRLPPIPGLRVVTLDNADAARFRCGLIGLKGELGRRVLQMLSDEQSSISSLIDPQLDVLDVLDGSQSTSARASN